MKKNLLFKGFVVVYVTFMVVSIICGIKREVEAKEIEVTEEVINETAKAGAFTDEGTAVGSITLKDGTIIEMYDNIEAVTANVRINGFKNPLSYKCVHIGGCIFKINGEYQDINDIIDSEYADEVMKLYTQVY